MVYALPQKLNRCSGPCHDSRTLEAEARELLHIWGQPGLRSPFQTNQSYILTPFLKNKTKQKQNKKKKNHSPLPYKFILSKENMI